MLMVAILPFSGSVVWLEQVALGLRSECLHHRMIPSSSLIWGLFFAICISFSSRAVIYMTGVVLICSIGLSIAELLGCIETFYDATEQARANIEHEPSADEDGNEILLPVAESEPWQRPTIDHDFKVKVWNTLIARDDIIVGDAKPGRCKLSLDEVEARPLKEPVKEAADADLLSQPAAEAETQAPPVEYQPRVHVAQSRLWLVLTGHDVDKTKLPFSEWQLLLAIAAAGKNGILQAEARNQTGQDKRSVPRRTDFLSQKGYIEKKQVLAFSQKTSLLTHKIFLESNAVQQEIPNPAELPASVLTQDLKPVPGHEHWTGIFVDTEMVARAAVSIIRAWGVIRRTHILAKMNIRDLRLRKTLERTIRKLFEFKVCKRVSALLPDNPKVFKDCVKFLREPTDEEWSHFMKKLTSQGFKNRPSRAKPKSEHRPRVRKQVKLKSKKTAIGESSNDAFEDDLGEESEESDGDFFGGDDDDVYDAADKPTLMTSTKETIEDTIEEAIEANPGEGGISEGDLLVEVDALSKKDLLTLFTPFDVSSAQPAEFQTLRIVREPIEKAGKEVYQYYTISNFKRRVSNGESNWDGVFVLRHSKPVDKLTSRDRETTDHPESLTAISQSIALPSSFASTTPSKTAVMNPPMGITETGGPSRPGTPVASSATATHAGTPSRPQVGPPRRPRGRPKKPLPADETKTVTYTSHDQLQREDGVPGVYFDLPDFEPPKNQVRGPPGELPRGRKPKKKMMMIKSDKLKDLDWTPKEPSSHVKDGSIGIEKHAPSGSKPSEVNKQQGHAAPTPKIVKSNADMSTYGETPTRSFPSIARNFATAPASTYKSPYQSTPAAPSMPKPAAVQPSTYVSPYAASLPRIYSSPYAQSSAAPKTADQQPHVKSPPTSMPAQLVQQPSTPQYRSPYAAVDGPPKAPRILPAAAPAVPTVETSLVQVAPVRRYKSPYAQVATAPAETVVTPGPSSAEVSPIISDSQALADSQLVIEMEAAAGQLSPAVEERVLSEEQQRMDADINTAANEMHPDQSAQLAVRKDGIVGNLCLDNEKVQITFFPLDSEDLVSKFTLDISSITSPPVADIELYELIITTGESTEESDDSQCQNETRFFFASTSTEAANNLRAKIATAMTVKELKAKKEAMPLWAFPVPNGGQKPFRCDQCPNSWKNYEGIKYHKTKARVTCNPNWVPPPVPPPGEEKKKRRKGYVDLDELPAEEVARIAAQRQLGDGVEPLPDDEDRPKRRAYRRRQPKERKEPKEPKDSEEPEESGNGRRTPMQAGTTVPTTVETITAGESSKAATPEMRVLFAAKEQLKYPTSNDRDNIERRTGPVVTQQRKDVIMDLIEANGGVFPGDQGLWFAMHAVWTQKYPNSVIQDYKYCNRAVELLQDGGYITKLSFSFRDQTGRRLRNRHIITKKGVDPLSPEVANLKENIKEVFPKYYCPSDFAPPESVQTMLNARESRPSEEDRQKRQLEKEQQEGPKVREEKEAEALKQARILSTVVEQPKQNADNRGATLSSDDEEIALLSAPFYAPDPDAEGETDEEYQQEMAKQRRKGQKRTPTKRVRSDSFREGQSSRMKALWANLKAQGSTLRDMRTHEGLAMNEEGMFIEESESELESEFEPSDAEFEIEAYMESEHYTESEELPLTATEQKQADHDSLHGWQTAPSLLQSADGSWGQEPPKPKKPKRAYVRKPVLPEPVTYMQTADDPGWSFRPFGHGVRPIYARPSRRVGNQKYLEKVEGGFRPVIIPKTRQFGPARPAKSKNGHGPLAEAVARKRKGGLGAFDESARKRAKKARMDDRMDDQRPYGITATGEEIPWPDFRPLPLPYGRKRTKLVMPEWSSNPGLVSLVNAAMDVSVIPDFGSRSGRAIAFDDDLADTEGEEMPYEVRHVDQKQLQRVSGSRMQGLFSRSTASFRDRLPKNLQGIISEMKGVTPEADATADLESTDFMSEVTATAEWEQSIRGRTLLGMGTIKPGEIYINYTVKAIGVPHTEGPPTISWSAENNFTLETLPYKLLAFDTADLLSAPPKLTRVYNKRQKIDQASSYFGMVEATAFDFEGTPFPSRKRKITDAPLTSEPRPKRAYRRHAQTKDFRVRRLTSLPMDIQGLPLPVNDPDFQVAVSHHSISGHRKRTNERSVISEALDDRLIVAVVVIRTLTGGLDQSVDWVLVSSLFPQCTMNWVRRHFGILAEKHAKRLERMTGDFQTAYLDAYESGELPKLDYDHILEYDWNELINWTMERTQVVSTSNVSLPDSRERFDQMYELQDTEERVWRDSYFSGALPVHKRIAHASAGNTTLPVSVAREIVPKPDEDLLRIARSWARASTLTPAGIFDPSTATAKMQTLGQEIVRDAISQLLEAKVIMPVNKGRPVPGRGFEVTDALTASFSRILSRAHYDEAAAFKARLDDAFRMGKTVMLEYTASEGEILAATNLQATRRTVHTPRRVPMNKFGLTEGNYQTKQMNKTKLLFDIEISPSDTYVYDDEHPLHKSGLLDAEKNPPPKPNDGALPIWYDVYGQLIPGIWRKVVGSALATIMQRPGIDAKEVSRLLKPALEEWEATLFVEWAFGADALKEVAPGSGIEGWTVGEWWWWIAGKV